MTRKALFTTLMLMSILLASCRAKPTSPTPEANVPNPASVNCEQNGGKVELREDASGGVAGVCVFPDGSECDEWAYFRGECKPGDKPMTSEPTSAVTGATQPGLPPELSVEEHPLTKAPDVEPLTFAPVQGTQEEILAKHQQEREESFPDNSYFVNGQPGISVQLGDVQLVAWESYIGTATSQGTVQTVSVQVMRDEEVIYSIPAGVSSPIGALRGLWAYANHWTLEIAHVDRASSGNATTFDSYGQIIQDGQLLNEQYGYEEAFGFQLMDGKPFFFFQRDGQIGISYDGQEVPLEYDQIPHYQCCSAAELNPRSAQTMVAFYAQRDGVWYYVEIGIFKPTTGRSREPTPLATPVSQEPAAGVCPTHAGNVVTVTLYPDTPDPRCAQISPEQRLSIVNRTERSVQVGIGSFEASLEPGAERTFDAPFREYLAPGVHRVQVLPCCGPELWLVAASAVPSP